MGKSGVAPAGTYGNTAIGASKTELKKQKQNMAAASGKGLRKGASATIAIEMTYGREAQPDIIAHMGHIETWLRYYDTHAMKATYLVSNAWE